jgi:hypothetical protein
MLRGVSEEDQYEQPNDLELFQNSNFGLRIGFGPGGGSEMWNPALIHVCEAGPPHPGLAQGEGTGFRIYCNVLPFE